MEDKYAVIEDYNDICEGCVTGKSSIIPFCNLSYGEVKTTLLPQLI